MSSISVPTSAPAPTEDCEQLHNAISGWGTNEGTIISILAHRSASQRRLICDAYFRTYGVDLLKALQKDLTRHFERMVLTWTLGPAERDAVIANEEIKKWEPGDRALIELACARRSEELLAAKRVYHERFKRSLEEDVAAHISGDFRKLMVPLISSFRYDGPEVNETLAKAEAKLLHDKISSNVYNDEEIIRILTTRSEAQLIATLNEYNNEFGHPINKDLKSDPKDDFLGALRAIVKCTMCPEAYFEKIIRLAVDKTGTDEGALTRVITTRAEVDMQAIKEQYFKKNGVALSCAIEKDTHGDYEEFLLALIGRDGA